MMTIIKKIKTRMVDFVLNRGKMPPLQIMRKTIFALLTPFVIAGLCAASAQGKTTESSAQAAGANTASENKTVSSSGVSYDPLPPSDPGPSPVAPAKTVPAPVKSEKPVSVGKDTPAAKSAEPVAVRKDTSVAKTVEPVAVRKDTPVVKSVEPVAVPKAAPVAKSAEPVAVRKDASAAKNGAPAMARKDASAANIEIADEKEKKKQSKREKAEDKARTKALNEVVDRQVAEMRNEREKEMPYLDRVYIRTSITPFKIQQKEEFLSGGSKDLDDLIIRAKSVHTQAKAAHENIALYNRRVLQAFRKLFPEASFNFNDREGLLSNNAFTGDDWHVSLRQPIFNGGVLWNTLLQEKANLEASKKQYDKTLAELVFDISRAYFEYQRTLQTADENRVVVDKMKHYADMSEEKYSEKLISEIERLNVQSLYSQMQFDLESANQELEIAKLDLQKYLDLSVNDQFAIAKIYNLDDVVQGQAAPAKSVAGGTKVLPDVFKGEGKAPELSKLIDLSYGHRPELQVEAAKLQASRLGERIRWGEFLPKANLTYKFGALGEAYLDNAHVYGSNYDAKNEPQLKKEWELMLEVNWNVGGNKVNYTFDRDHKAPSITQFDQANGSYLRKNGLTFGVLDGLDAFVNVKQAEVDKLNQVVELEKAEKQVLQDVKQAYYDFQKSLIQVNSTVKRLEYRKRLRDFSEHRLSKKEIELSEYLQAESDLVREKAELHKALKEYFCAKAALNHAVGIQDFFNMNSPQKNQIESLKVA